MYTGEEHYRGEVPPEIRRTAGPAPRPGAAWDDAPEPGGPHTGARRSRRRALAWCAALLLVPVSVPLVFRGVDSDGPTPIPQLLAFLPWFLAPGWLALALAVLGRRWLVTVWSVAVLAATGWFIQPYGDDAALPREHAPTARFRILTANLEYGQATEALLRTVRRERPQLVSVQECDRGCAAALRSAELREAYPHRIITEAQGAGGSALLSTFPLQTRAPVRGQLSMPGAVVDVDGTPVRVQVAHPMPPEPSSLGVWKRELGRLRGWAAARGDTPTVLAGDFNATQDHAAFRAVLDTGLRDAARLQGQSRTPTWPSVTAPPLGAQIDHVLLSDHFEAADAEFLDLAGSDHRALLVDLRMY